MHKRADTEWIGDIRVAIGRIELYVRHASYKKFLNDTKIQDAVVRNLEVIGEACKNISPAFKRKNKYVQWKNIAGMRDKLIHHYFGINLEIVWNVAKEKLPELKTQIKRILKEKKK